MRETYDRLVGPVAIRQRKADSLTVARDPNPSARLVPVDLERWKVVPSTRRKADLRRALAERASADDAAVARLAGQFGLPAGAPVVDAARAAQLVHAIRAGSVARDQAPLRHPLVVYAPGEDPRDMWKTHVDPKLFSRDRADDIADAIAACLRTLAARAEHVEWRRRGTVAARTWIPSEGTARLYRLAVAQARNSPALGGAAWVPVFSHALLQSSTKVGDARMLWHDLVAVGPLLLVLADADGNHASGRPRLDVLGPTVQGWRKVAVEADAWLTALDELAAMDEELASSRQRRRARDEMLAESIDQVRTAVAALREALHGPNLDLYHRLFDLEATDTQGIRHALEGVLLARLGADGVGAGTAPGTLIGLEAAMLLAVHAAFERGRCIECGGPTRGQRSRCLGHQRAVWRDRKRRQRRNGGSRAKPAPVRSGRSARQIVTRPSRWPRRRLRSAAAKARR